MEIGDRIKEMRRNRGMTQVQLSKLTGLSQSSISDIENKTNNPSSATLQLIAAAFGCSITALIAPNEKPTAAGDGLDQELIDLVTGLSPQEIQRVRDFVAGLIASRAK